MRPPGRRATLPTRGGRTRPAQNFAPHPRDYYQSFQPDIAIHRRHPGAGYRHVVTARDVQKFVELIPDWAEISEGLDALVLSPGVDREYGYHTFGVIHLRAWPRALHRPMSRPFYDESRAVLDRLGVPVTHTPDGVLALWTLPTARAFMLLNIFLHELGHHHDRTHTRSARTPARGEPYAEAFAVRLAAQIGTRYERTFGPL